MWALVGEGTTVNLDFTNEGQFVRPDAGSVKVTVRDNNGVALPGWTKVEFPVPGTSLNLELPAELNTIPSGLIFETRYIRVEYKVDGKPNAITKHYRVTPFIPLAISAVDVRSRLGANEQEVPDDQIDIHMAFYKLQASGQLSLLTALKANTEASLAANNAIAIKAALEHLPALAAKLAQSEAQDNATRQRMKLDIPQLKKDLLSALEAELASMAELLAGGSISTLPTLMVLTTPTDVITG